RLDYFVISYDKKEHDLWTEARGNFRNDFLKNIADPEMGKITKIDPYSRVIGMYMYNGTLVSIKLDCGVNYRGTRPEKKPLRLHGFDTKPINIRLKHLLVRDMTFLYFRDIPILALLHEGGGGDVFVKAYPLYATDIGNEFWSLENLDETTRVIEAVPTGGFLLISSTKVSYYDENRKCRSVELPHESDNTVIAAIDEDGSRYLIGDSYGTLHLLVIPDKKPMYTYILGKISVPRSIVYLDHAYVFVGSHFGDSQFIKLRSEPNEQGLFLDVIDSITNLAPIHDFCVMKMERQEQSQVITCSGGIRDGSLRIIRNGVGITVQADVQMAGITGVWPLRPYYGAQYDDTLVVSFIGETRVLRMLENSKIQEVYEYTVGFDMNQETLATNNVIGNLLVQVTRTFVRLIDLTSKKITSEWNPPDDNKITVADINPTQVLIATNGIELIYFEFLDAELVEVSRKRLFFEVSCINIHPLDTIDKEKSTIAAIGLWNMKGLKILNLPSLTVLTDMALDSFSIARSILLETFENINYLLVTVGDGQLYHFTIDPTRGLLLERKRFTIGTQPVMLAPFITNGVKYVFAASDKPSIIFSANKKLLFSSVNTKVSTPIHICSFLFHHRPSADMTASLVIIHSEGLTIGCIDEIQKLHIRSIPLYEMPRRIQHQESTHTIGILTIRAILDEATNSEKHIPYFKVMDDQTFEFYDYYALQPYETVFSLSSVKFDSEDDAPEYYVVGTGYLSNQVDNNTDRGRLLIFIVEKTEMNLNIRLVYQKEMTGTVYSALPFDEKLLIGVNGKVAVYELKTLEDGGHELIRVCEYAGFTLAVQVVTRGHFVLVGDILRSIVVLAYKDKENGSGKTLEFVAQDPYNRWAEAIEAISDDEFICSESSFNSILALRRNVKTEDLLKKEKLELTGSYNLGDSINRFRHGSLAANNHETLPDVTSELLYVTSSGAIGVIASISPQKYSTLLKLVEAMDFVLGDYGDIKRQSWRCVLNSRNEIMNTNRFIDGDHIESLLEQKPEDIKKIANRCKMNIDDMMKLVEELTRIH
ncbi:14785_t:CDS:10, partial [Acaulospora morrowiae]